MKIGNFLIQSWWIIAFILGVMIVYEHALKQREAVYQQLTEQLTSLQLEKEEVIKQQQNLQRQINSQSDLAWVELTLMRKLGLTPEGQTKVYFFPIEENK